MKQFQKSPCFYTSPTRAWLLFFFINFLFTGQSLFSQENPFTKDTIPVINSALIDSLMKLSRNPETRLDSTGQDSISLAGDPLQEVTISKDALDEEVRYSARDTTIYDLTNETVYLYGAAKVEYTDITLEADMIIFNWRSNEVIAEGVLDTLSGRIRGYPMFKDGNQTFEAKNIRYNVKSRKGIVKNVITRQGSDLYVVGDKAKFSSVEDDSLGTKNVVYSQDAIFTTCDHPEPHFGIRSKKQKVIPNKVVVVGPSNLEIMGVPTPLWLPFGFYPITQQGSTGLIFPQDYENSDNLGFGLKGVGWYFPINDYMNLELTADYYLRGTWGVSARTSYKRLYKYNGNFAVSYSSIANEDAMALPFRSNATQIRWSHTQDQKANPIHNFRSSVNITTNTEEYFGQRETSAAQSQNNRLNSSVTYTRKFPGKKWGFSASFNHNQNRQNNSVSFTLPNLLFTTGNFNPFKSKGGKKKWNDNFNFSYRGQAEARFTSTDTTLFSQQTLESTNPGMRHTVTGSFNTRVLKFFNYSINSSFSENWYMKSTRKMFDDTIEADSIYTEGPDSVLLRIDTSSYGMVVDEGMYGFNAFHNLKNTNMSLTTKLFSTMLFKKGKVRGLRHVATPSFGFAYNPAQTQYFENFVDTDVRPEENDPLAYSIFEDVIYDKPTMREEQVNFTYNIGNTLEAKFYNKKKKETKNIKLLESFTVGGNYNFVADSLHWSDPSFSARTTIFKRLISLQYRGVVSFYEKDPDLNKRVDKLLVKNGGGLFRLDNASLNVNTGLTVRQFLEIVRGENNKKTPAEGTLESLIDNFRVNYNLVMRWTTPKGEQQFDLTTNTIDLRGGLKLTENWDVSISRIGYSFTEERLTYPDLTFSRNLHCWQMSVTWRPNANTFFFSLGVRPGTLDFIKVPYKRNAPDGFLSR
ncbi:MAG: LPS-assembly protein LptD [Saprospiraceae bacterium]|nr:LPS-assembly protein LptD [Saprospiraceae bacterium]